MGNPRSDAQVSRKRGNRPVGPRSIRRVESKTRRDTRQDPGSSRSRIAVILAANNGASNLRAVVTDVEQALAGTEHSYRLVFVDSSGAIVQDADRKSVV